MKSKIDKQAKEYSRPRTDEKSEIKSLGKLNNICLLRDNKEEDFLF